MSPIDDALSALPPELLHRSGRVFYTGQTAFAQATDLYVLGLNPGGSIEQQIEETIRRDLTRWRSRVEPWSAYCDETWKNGKRGGSPLQLRVRHLLDRIGRLPEQTPASNAIFVRTNDEAALAGDKSSLMTLCWPVHRAVIEQLGIKTILCFGQTVTHRVRQQLGSTSVADEGFQESNERKWRGSTSLSPTGIAVVQLPHPARANWCGSGCDPGDFVRTVIDR